MIEYRVKADRHVVVDGLGTFTPGEERTFTEYDEQQFQFMRGLRLLQTNVPDGVEVTMIITPDKKEEEGE